MIRFIYDSFLLFVTYEYNLIRITRNDIYERGYFQNLSIFIDLYDGIECRRFEL